MKNEGMAKKLQEIYKIQQGYLRNIRENNEISNLVHKIAANIEKTCASECHLNLTGDPENREEGTEKYEQNLAKQRIDCYKNCQKKNFNSALIGMQKSQDYFS